MKSFVEIYAITVILPDDTEQYYSFINEFDRDEFAADLREYHKDCRSVSWNKMVTIDEGEDE